MSQADYLEVLVYSDDASIREQVKTSVGLRAARDLPPIKWDEAATATIAQDKIENGRYAAVVLDAEATKISGNIVAKNLQVECDYVPPIIMLVARPQDEWLSTWAGASAIVQRPINPITVQETLAKVLR